VTRRARAPRTRGAVRAAGRKASTRGGLGAGRRGGGTAGPRGGTGGRPAGGRGGGQEAAAGSGGARARVGPEGTTGKRGGGRGGGGMFSCWVSAGLLFCVLSLFWGGTGAGGAAQPSPVARSDRKRETGGPRRPQSAACAAGGAESGASTTRTSTGDGRKGTARQPAGAGGSTGIQVAMSQARAGTDAAGGRGRGSRQAAGRAMGGMPAAGMRHKVAGGERPIRAGIIRGGAG